MADPKKLEAHLFVCTNHKENGASCAARGAAELRNTLKTICQDPARHWHGRVRVNASGCLGQCEKGIAAVLYPKAEWFTELKKDDAKILETALSGILD